MSDCLKTLESFFGEWIPLDESELGLSPPPVPISEAFFESTLRVLRRFIKLPAREILLTFCFSDWSSASPRHC